MSPINELPFMNFSVDDETDTKEGKAYDNIVCQSNYSNEFIEAGLFKFEHDYNLTNDKGFSISDNHPVWSVYNNNKPD